MKVSFLPPCVPGVFVFSQAGADLQAGLWRASLILSVNSKRQLSHSLDKSRKKENGAPGHPPGHSPAECTITLFHYLNFSCLLLCFISFYHFGLWAATPAMVLSSPRFASFKCGFGILARPVTTLSSQWISLSTCPHSISTQCSLVHYICPLRKKGAVLGVIGTRLSAGLFNLVYIRVINTSLNSW